jgi:RND family efflux transporter MFP subunit
MIGVKVMTVQKAPWNHTLRALGRVTPDETRIYRINAAVNGWIVEALPLTTGGQVQKDALLATFSFYSTEFRQALQAYVNIVNAGNIAPEATASQSIQSAKEQRAREYENIRLTGGRGASAPQTDIYRQNLFSYGITQSQLEEIERTRKVPEAIDIRSPAAGFILLRNVSPGLRFDRGTELFRIADLSEVWILADAFENEASFFKPGMLVKVELPYQKKTIYARMSNVLPQFDPATRTLKVRLVADNPGYAMRPDMFVNVELPVSGPPAIIVPVDAVLDSGLKKTVFVDRGNSFFEPRQVETGRLLGERVEIARGLMPGEKIVVSGNFLLDSEARMQKAAAGVTGKIARDPVCGMNIDEDSARAAGNYLEYRGQTYFFCDPKDREDFRKEPERYLKSPMAQGSMPKSESTPTKKHASHDMKAMPMPRQNEQAPVSGSQGATPMPTMKAMDKFQAGPAPPVQAMPESGNAGMPPGPKGFAPMPGAKTGGVFSPVSPGADFKSIPQMSTPIPRSAPTSGPTSGPAMQPAPGSQEPATVSEPPTEGPVRSTSRPPRTRGPRPLGGIVTPGSQDVPAVPQPKTNAMPPGTGTSPVEQPQMNAPDVK